VNEIKPPYNEKDIQIYGLNNTEIAVRGELIISKENWEALGAMGKQGANPRNTVAGAINSDILKKDLLSKIDFVAYTLVHPQLKDGLNKLQELGFKVAYNISTRSMNLENLSKILETRRAESEYVIDGIVIEDTSKYYDIEKGKNPEHSFAFKSIHTLEQVEVMVSKVEWNVSKDMYMKPIVMFKEIDLDGVKIKQATGFNASYIVKNVVGPGSRIIIIRSGNVIPHIQSVLTPSATGTPSMPGIEGEDYIWNDTRVDIMLTSKVGVRNRDYDIKNLTYFMKTANIEYMGPGNIAKLYDAGFVDIKMIANIKMDDLLKIDGIKDKGATNIITALAEIKNIECLTLMDASNIMGRGFSYKKIKIITDMYPHILYHDKKSRALTSKLTAEDLMRAEGIAETSATLFLSNLPKFYDFYDNLGIKCKAPDNAGAAPAAGATMIDANILGKSFVFTGFRDKDLEAYITRVGGFVKTTISKNTDYLVVADINDTNNKTEKASSLGVPIILRDNSVFAKMPMLSRKSHSPSHPQAAQAPSSQAAQTSQAPSSQASLPRQSSPQAPSSQASQAPSPSPPQAAQAAQASQAPSSQASQSPSSQASQYKHLFKPLPQGGEDRFTLITFANSFRPTKGKTVKVMFADLDHTLITPKGKHVFPKTIDDWRWKNDAIVPKMKDLYYNMGYEIVIVSNQKKMSGDDVRTKATMIYNDLQIPFVFISGHSDLYYRKPQLGLWEVLGEYIFNGIANIDPSSVFIGDSVADLYFARNTNMKFLHTDLFFNGVPNVEFARIEEREHPLTQWVSKKAPEVPALKASVKNLVIMVGPPASGKSYYSSELERKGYLRINKDTMKNDKEAMKVFAKGLSEGRNIVIDNTNPTKEVRAMWINAARNDSYYITIMWMNFPIPVVEYLDSYRIAKNKSQSAHVPAVGMRVYYKKLEAPTQQECDNLVEIKTIKAGEMLSVWL
jgi:DNA 3'-phosphatase